MSETTPALPGFFTDVDGYGNQTLFYGDRDDPRTPEQDTCPICGAEVDENNQDQLGNSHDD